MYVCMYVCICICLCIMLMHDYHVLAYHVAELRIGINVTDYRNYTGLTCQFIYPERKLQQGKTPDHFLNNSIPQF